MKQNLKILKRLLTNYQKMIIYNQELTKRYSKYYQKRRGRSYEKRKDRSGYKISDTGIWCICHFFYRLSTYLVDLPAVCNGVNRMEPGSDIDVFYLSFVTFVLGNIVGGRIQDKRNPKIAIVSGGAIFTASILLKCTGT